MSLLPMSRSNNGAPAGSSPDHLIIPPEMGQFSRSTIFAASSLFYANSIHTPRVSQVHEVNELAIAGPLRKYH